MIFILFFLTIGRRFNFVTKIRLSVALAGTLIASYAIQETDCSSRFSNGELQLRH